MASILDMSASSDSEDDVDYVPPTNGEASDSSCEEELMCDNKSNGKKMITKIQEDKKDVELDSTSKKVDEKQRANELWASFLKDVESVSPKKSNTAVCNSNNTNLILSESGIKVPSKIEAIKPFCKVFEFAGETITVDNDSNSCVKKTSAHTSEKNLTDKAHSMPSKRGIESILGAISNKAKKLTVLDKSKMDWLIFKKDEGIDEELQCHNKGKDGFLEKKRFLERSDLRSFEIEKSMRQTLRKK